MTPDTSGRGSQTPFAFYDRASSSWRTSQGTFPLDSTPCSVTLPPSGSMLDGRLFARPMSEPATDELDSSLLPTPAVNDMGAGKTPEEWDAWRMRMRERHGNGNGHGPSLAIEAARLLPTPRASENENRQTKRTPSQEAGKHGLSLAAEVGSLLPTPRSADGMNDTMAAAAAAARVARSGYRSTLEEACSLLPTPTSGDAKSTRNSTAGRRRVPPTGIHAGDTLTDLLVPAGERTSPPSDDTNKPSDDPRQPRLWEAS